jgi:N-acyl-L-homoserine lactone synthetase
VFRYRIAEAGTDDLENWHRLRTQLYLDAGLLTTSDLDASGLYRDQYSEHSIHILGATDDGVDIGCWRMIEPAEGRTLPVTDLFGIEILPRAYESSGTAIKREYRKSIASLGFYRALSELADEKGYELAYGIVEVPVLESIRRLGLPIEVISDPRHVFNAANVATVSRRSEIIESLRSAHATRDGVSVADFWDRPFDWKLSMTDLSPLG